MGSLYSTTAGDTAPTVKTVLRNAAGTAQPLAGATVKMQVDRLGEFDAVPTGVAGEVQTTFPADLAPGIYHMKHVVTFGDLTVTSFPKDDWDVLEVLSAPAIPAP